MNYILRLQYYRIEEEQNIKVSVSPPIVVYREGIQGNNHGHAFEGKSPNRHNRFFFEIEPLTDEVVAALRAGDLGDGAVRSNDAKEIGNKFGELGMNKDLMRKIYAINGSNVLVNDTKGIQGLHETRELIIEAFNAVCVKGPIADEPVQGMFVRLVDAKLARRRNPPWTSSDHPCSSKRNQGRYAPSTHRVARANAEGLRLCAKRLAWSSDP